MVIGEAPGEQEDIQGQPFVGRSGKLLDKMLAYIGLDRTNVYVTNIVKVRPDDNRTPTQEEIDSWFPLLVEEIKKQQPKVVLMLGTSAAKPILHRDEGISKFRGKPFTPICAQSGLVGVATYHPSYLLRKQGDEQTKSLVKADLDLVKSILENGYNS